MLQQWFLELEAKAQHFEELWRAVPTTEREDKAVETEERETSEAETKMLMEEEIPERHSKKKKKLQSQKDADS